MQDLTSFRKWNESSEENLHSGDAMKTYQSGVDNSALLDCEEENGILAAFIERLGVRLDKLQDEYDQHISGEIDTEAFLKKLDITKMLLDDFTSYAERYGKLARVSGKKQQGR